MSKLPMLTSLVLLTSVAYAETSQSLTTGSSFNPQISLILDGNYYHDNQRGKGSDVLAEMAGIGHGAHSHEHGHGELAQGFNLGESELVMSAVVDPYFDGRLTLAVGSGGDVALEESWLQTRLLPYGLKVKMGKFLSGIGYQNSQHRHAWDFADQNLAYLGLLGGEGFKDTGVQLTWVAPTAIYTLLGVEALQGNDQERFGTVIDNDDAETVVGSSPALPDTKAGPRITTVFARIAPDIGEEQALQLGLSYARTQQYQQVIDVDGAALSGDEYAADGTQQLYGMDAVYKWDSPAEYGQGDLKVTGEYLRLKKDLTVTGTGSPSAVAVRDAITGTQDGYYLQASYGIAPRWQLALRQDANGLSNELDEGMSHQSFKQSSRQSIALSFAPSEFSRLRLQLAQGNIYDNAGDKTALKQVFLQYTQSLGTHGAHKF